MELKFGMKSVIHQLQKPMFKPFYGRCKGKCGKNNQLIPVKSGLCERCNYEQKQNKKKSEGKSIKKYTYVKEATGEAALMQNMVEGLPDHETRCFVCNKRIAVLTYSNMAHILPKGKFPAYRLYSANIKIMCFNLDGTGCHSRLDHQPKSTLIEEGWQKVFDLQEELKSIYPQIL
jgi:hypothetical protein